MSHWDHVAFESDRDFGFACGHADAVAGEEPTHTRSTQYCRHQDYKHIARSEFARGYVAGFDAGSGSR